MYCKVFVTLVFTLIFSSVSVMAQEVCFTDAQVNFENWRNENGSTLADLARKFEASADPTQEMVEYNGMEMPIAAALIIEGQKYGKEADAKLRLEIDSAKSCSGRTDLPRGVYDLARELLGLTTILPEAATRIDFEELLRGNIPGGPNSTIRETGRFIDETFNPFRW